MTSTLKLIHISFFFLCNYSASMAISAPSLLTLICHLSLLISATSSVHHHQHAGRHHRTIASSFKAPPNQDTFHTSSVESAATNLRRVLTDLGFKQLAVAVPPIHDRTSPTTVFAPSDDSMHTCTSCSVSLLLREHIIRGLLPLSRLRKLPSYMKLETLIPNRCVTITSSAISNAAVNSSRIFVDGVGITRPNLYDDGRIVIHGVEGVVSHLSPLSCRDYRSTSVSFSSSSSSHPKPSPVSFPDPFTIMPLMLDDAMVRLRKREYSILALAMKMKYLELVNLNSMTIFAMDDESIFGGGIAYVNNVRFHIVPDRLLTHEDLAKMKAGTKLDSLVQGQKLLLTSTGPEVMINFIPIMKPEVMQNIKIVVHGINLPFPRLQDSSGAPIEPPKFAALAGLCSASDPNLNASEALQRNVSSAEPTGRMEDRG